jgi:hypothetical protein
LAKIRLYLKLCVVEIVFYLRYLCFFAHSDVQHILCWVLNLLVFFLFTLCCQFLWIVLFWLPLRYSPTFILGLYINFVLAKAYTVIMYFDVNATIWLADPPRATLVILDNVGWYCDVNNIFIRQRQIQIVPWNNHN